MASSLGFENSPNPWVLCAGGDASYYLVVWHFTRDMLWVFGDAMPAASFWRATADARAMFQVGAGALPLDAAAPALYSIKRAASSDGHAVITDCFAPLDVAGCLTDEPYDVALIYCSFTLRDSLRNPYLRQVRVFHDIGLDR
jgi:hypothetical protein